MSDKETRRESGLINETRKESARSNQTRREGDDIKASSYHSTSHYHDLLSPILPPGYSVLSLLSSKGGESDVYLIAKGPDKEVIKLYRPGVDIKESTLQEMKTLSEKYPEHLIEIYDIGYHTEAGRWYERMEYASHGNLRSFVPYGYAGKRLIDAVCHEIKSALEVLHENNLIHRDLKPENIMVRSKNPLDLVFADFGMSSSIDNAMSQKMTMTAGGTPEYMAPESFMSMDGQTITGPAVDLWAFGIILYEMITGHTPFEGIHPLMIGNKIITEGVLIDEEEIPVEFHEYLPLLKSYLHRDPGLRERNWIGELLQSISTGNGHSAYLILEDERKLNRQTTSEIREKLKELDVEVKELPITSDIKPKDIAGLLTTNAPNTVVIFNLGTLDQIPMSIFEMIVLSICNLEIDWIIGQGPSARMIRIPLPPVHSIILTSSKSLYDSFNLYLAGRGIDFIYNKSSKIVSERKSLLSNLNKMIKLLKKGKTSVLIKSEDEIEILLLENIIYERENARLIRVDNTTESKDIAGILTTIEENTTIIFSVFKTKVIDYEIIEMIKIAVSDYELDWIIGEGPSARRVRIPIPPFQPVIVSCDKGILIELQKHFTINDIMCSYNETTKM